MIGRLFVRVRSVWFVAFVSLMYNEKTGKLWTDYWCVYCAIYSVLYIVCSILFKRNWVCLAWGHDCLRLGLEVFHMIDCKIFCPCSGCKENHFYSLPFGQAEASIYYSPDVIAELISQFFCYSNSSKNITCPSGKLKTEFTSPIAKSTSPRLSDITFFARCCSNKHIYLCLFVFFYFCLLI